MQKKNYYLWSYTSSNVLFSPSGDYARFNMNKASGQNYNWGKGTLTLQQFDKPL